MRWWVVVVMVVVGSLVMMGVDESTVGGLAVEVDGGELIGLECPSKNEKMRLIRAVTERVNIFNVCSADQSTRQSVGPTVWLPSS
jgi:hypothetical protein